LPRGIQSEAGVMTCRG